MHSSSCKPAGLPRSCGGEAGVTGRQGWVCALGSYKILGGQRQKCHGREGTRGKRMAAKNKLKKEVPHLPPHLGSTPPDRHGLAAEPGEPQLQAALYPPVPPTVLLPSPALGSHSLVLNLKVEVPTEPVVEEGLFHVAGGCQLQRGRGEWPGTEGRWDTWLQSHEAQPCLGSRSHCSTSQCPAGGLSLPRSRLLSLQRIPATFSS